MDCRDKRLYCVNSCSAGCCIDSQLAPLFRIHFIMDKTSSNISKHDRLPQPQNTNHISSAPFREKLLSNSSYLAAEIPLKFGHWVSHLWNQQEQQQSSSDSTLWLLGCKYAVNMSNLEKDMIRAQREHIFHTSGDDDDNDDETCAAETTTTSSPASYDMTMPPDFYHDLCSRLWMTYRHNFPPIRPSAYKTDIGWGCMLRSGQSLLANTLLIHCLGRGMRKRHFFYHCITQSTCDRMASR